ncbi:MAG: 4-alpha-glucanotransferase [Pyrinomonadaceae bacterium]
MAEMFSRASGILLHPTSLPGKYGIGDLGSEAFKFVDLLEKAGQKLWQILPLSPTGQGNSPYSAYSAFAGNTLLISPEKLAADGLIENAEPSESFPEDHVDFERVGNWKKQILTAAFETFSATPNAAMSDEFDYFSRSNAWWLDDYAAFMALKTSHDNAAWFQWSEPLKLRDPAALDVVRSQLSREIRAEKFYQYLFFRQWLSLRRYANEKGIRIIGDIPIFVALDSADVWCNRSKFKLNEDGSPKVVAGVPPDYFSKTGQLWGNPIYDWEAMLKDDFGWWTARIAFTLETVDIVRLDHFIGFSRNWEVPGTDETAENGKWNDVPGRELFTVLNRRLGSLPVIAEDLGAMTPAIEELRDAFNFPGMRILQYAFGGDAYNRDLPHNFIRNSVAYTGTHDNDTTAGWYKKADKKARQHCREYTRSNGREIHWDMIRTLLGSTANTAIIPAQDLLGLGSEARMNTPATANGNWSWRLKPGELTEATAERLLELTKFFGR